MTHVYLDGPKWQSTIVLISGKGPVFTKKNPIGRIRGILCIKNPGEERWVALHDSDYEIRVPETPAKEYLFTGIVLDIRKRKA